MTKFTCTFSVSKLWRITFLIVFPYDASYLFITKYGRGCSRPNFSRGFDFRALKWLKSGPNRRNFKIRHFLTFFFSNRMHPDVRMLRNIAGCPLRQLRSGCSHTAHTAAARHHTAAPPYSCVYRRCPDRSRSGSAKLRLCSSRRRLHWARAPRTAAHARRKSSRPAAMRRNGTRLLLWSRRRLLSTSCLWARQDGTSRSGGSTAGRPALRRRPEWTWVPPPMTNKLSLWGFNCCGDREIVRLAS